MNGHQVSVDEQRIDAILADLDQSHLPGAAVGIAFRGRPVYRKAFGLANIELPATLTTATHMRVASISKHFVSLAYLLLCEDGLATLNDPVSRHLPELRRVAQNVPMRQLMNHTSGLRDVHDICFTFSGLANEVTSDEMLALYGEISDTNAPAGTTWSYNNGGYLLLSAAIERIADKALEDVLQERIFDPAGMYDSFLRRTDSGFVANSASAHMPDGKGGYSRRERSSIFITEVAGQGGIVSTVDDMLRWLSHMRNPTIGHKRTWKAMTTPARLVNGHLTSYGLGLIIGNYRGLDAIFHSGGGTGGNAHMVKLPGADIDVIAVTNRYDVSTIKLAACILDACFGLDAVEPAAAKSDLPVGAFQSPVTGRVIDFPTASDGDEPVRRLMNIDNLPLEVRKDGSKLVPLVPFEGRDTRAITLVGDPRRPSGIRLEAFGCNDEFSPLAAPELDRVESLIGRYRSPTINTELIVSKAAAGVYEVTTAGHFGSATYALEPIGARVFRMTRTGDLYQGGILTLETNDHIRIATGSNLAMPFDRLG